MPSLREIRRKVKSIKSTQQITKAMKMVSAARLRRAQSRIIAARPFAQKMQDLLGHILLELADVDKDNVLSAEELANVDYPLLKSNPEGPRALLLVTADKGLCGSFNSSLIKRALEFFRENQGQPVVLFCVGRKGVEFFRRQHLTVKGEYVNIFSQLSSVHAELIGNDVMNFFINEKARDVTLIYNEFKSAIQQTLVRTTLLPLTPPPAPANAPQQALDFIYEPAKGDLLTSLFPRYLKGQIYRALLESYASELGARMTAMENASRNAKDLIDGLTLYANKIRQTVITKEISELVGGAEALQ
jgi:F-type H+-transporting ATPase subunit gamma